MMKRNVFFILFSLVLILSPLFTCFAEPFYKDKNIKLIVSTRPGGGYDFYARMAAKYMRKYMPGSNIIVKNVPGAGHILGGNKLYVSKPDGLTFGAFSRALCITQIVGVKGVKFDLHKMSWLGSPSSDPRVLAVTKKTPFMTVDDIIKSNKKVRFAASGIGTMAYMDPLLIGKMLKAKNWKIVTGYGGGETQLAMMRGEVDATFMSLSTAQPFIADGSYRIIMFNAKEAVKGFEKYPLLKNVVDKKYKPVVDLMLFMVQLNRPFAGPPGIPADRYRILQDAFEKTWHDPELLAMMKKLKRPVNYIGGEEARALMMSFSKLEPETIALLKEAFGVK